MRPSCGTLQIMSSLSDRNKAAIKKVVHKCREQQLYELGDCDLPYQMLCVGQGTEEQVYV